MSRKPPKKSDRGKNWMRDRRDRSISMSPEYHLIVTEGTDTEPLYFMRMKEIINYKFRERIHLDISGEGDNTISLVEKAHKHAINSLNTYGHVWVVYDTDSFPVEHINQTVELCKEYSDDETRYHAIWSNQCIELWFLLHFSYFQSDIDRRGYWPKLTECLKNVGGGEYVKNRKDMYDLLEPFLDIAIKYAEKLDEKNKGKLPANAAPRTKVHELVKALRPYL